MTLLLCFLANALWQVPLLALSVLLVVRLTRPQPHTAYILWFAALTLASILPLAAALRMPATTTQPSIPAAAAIVPQSPGLTTAAAGASLAPVLPRESGDARHSHRFAAWAARIGAGRITRFSFPRLQAPRWLAWSLALLWAASTLLSAGHLLVRLRATSRLLRGASALLLPAPLAEELTQTAREFGLAAPYLAAHPAFKAGSRPAQGPALAGFWRPTLLLPPEFAAYAPLQRRAILAHELAHLRRRDPWTQLAASLLALSLAWHPACALILRRLAYTRELATDALAARHMGSARHYAECLLRLAQSLLPGSAPQSAALGLFQPAFLEQRIMQLIRPRHILPLHFRVPTIAAATLLTGAATALAASFPVGLSGALASPVPVQSPVPAGAAAAAPAPAVAPVAVQATAAPVLPSTVVRPSTPSAAPHAVPESPASPAASRVPPSIPPITGTTILSIPDMAGLPHVYALAHGGTASVSGYDGYTHRWTGADGLPFIAMTESPAELTPAQERALEEQFNLSMERAQQQIEQSTAYLRSPEFQQQMRKASQIDSEQLRKQIEQATASLRSPELQQQMQKASQIDSDQLRRQVEQSTAYLRSPEFQQQMQKASQIDGKQLQQQIEQSTAFLHSREFQQEMQKAGRTEDMQRQIDSLRSQVANLQRQLAQARTGSPQH